MRNSEYLMNLPNKNIFVLFLSFLLLFVFSLSLDAQRKEQNVQAHTSRQMESDSLINDTSTVTELLLTPDTLQLITDSIVGDTLVGVDERQDPLEAPVAYQAEDSIVWIVDNAKAYLYKDSKVDYQKIGLTAEQITVNIDQKTVYANGVSDSAGVIAGRPVFTDGDTP